MQPAAFCKRHAESKSTSTCHLLSVKHTRAVQVCQSPRAGGSRALTDLDCPRVFDRQQMIGLEVVIPIIILLRAGLPTKAAYTQHDFYS